MESAAGHPSFPNPTISEAVVEVHYRLPASAGWTPATISDYYRRVTDDFPRIEPFATVGVELQLTAEGVGQRLQPARQGMRFSREDGTLLLQLSQDMLSVNALPPYPGWESVRDTIGMAWSHAADIFGPEAVTRVGLRYINKVPLTDEAPVAGSWLKPTDYIPVAAVRGTGDSQLRLQTALGDYERVIVQLASPRPQEGDRWLVFDIDRISEETRDIAVDTVLQTATRLHEDVWQVFESALTDRLRAHLERTGG